MMSARTKVLMWSAALPPFAAIAAIVLPRVILYYEVLVRGRGADFIVVHFHLLPLAALLSVWALVVFGAVISFLYDKRKSGQT